MTAPASIIAAITAAARSRLTNVGGLYNCGNLLALAGAVAQSFVLAHGDFTVATTLLTQYFVGNFPALATTLAAVCFFIGGEDYYQAWRVPVPPDLRHNAHGHLWSAAGALLLATGLAGLGDSAFAVAAALLGGVLHVGGKLGSVFVPAHDKFFKSLPLLSRVPAITAATADIAHSLNLYSWPEAISHALLPVFLVFCSLVWGSADVMMMRRIRLH